MRHGCLRWVSRSPISPGCAPRIFSWLFLLPRCYARLRRCERRGLHGCLCDSVVFARRMVRGDAVAAAIGGARFRSQIGWRERSRERLSMRTRCAKKSRRMWTPHACGFESASGHCGRADFLDHAEIEACRKCQRPCATPVQRSLRMVTIYLVGRLVYRERNVLNTIG